MTLPVKQSANPAQKPSTSGQFMINARLRALTLVELIVVLLILVILTTVTLQTTESAFDQGRFDVSRRRLDEIEKALTGLPPIVQGDGSLQIQGYVADMGGLPASLNDLINPPNPTTYVFPMDDDLPKIGAGWRGPYISLPIGTETVPTLEEPEIVRDGFNSRFDYPIAPEFDPENSARLIKETIRTITTGRAAPFNREQKITVNPFGFVVGQVRVVDASNNPMVPMNDLIVELYAPNGAGVLEPTQIRFESPTMSEYTFDFKNISAGPRAIRAVIEGGRKGSYVYITVVPEQTTTHTLTIRGS